MIEYILEKNLKALKKLLDISMQFNKEDNFIPNIADISQRKFFPTFIYNEVLRQYQFSGISLQTKQKISTIHPLICFCSYERAKQFALENIKTINEYML